jgi:hypothetical protein
MPLFNLTRTALPLLSLLISLCKFNSSMAPLLSSPVSSLAASILKSQIVASLDLGPEIGEALRGHILLLRMSQRQNLLARSGSSVSAMAELTRPALSLILGS